MSVPVRRGPWWYYSRTEEGKSYAIHCRRPAGGRDELPPAGEPGEEEQVLLDENVEAEGSEYFAVGGAAVSHDHHWLAYSTDRAGDERYELRFRPLDDAHAPDAAPEVVPGTSYGLAWSAGAEIVFYVRMDEAPAPERAVAPPAGHRPGGRRAGLRGGGPAVLPRDRLDPRHRLRPGRAAQHEQHERVAAPSPRASRWQRRRTLRARPRGRRELLSGPPHFRGRRSRWMVRDADQ